jgi:hypothetical protein
MSSYRPGDICTRALPSGNGGGATKVLGIGQSILPIGRGELHVDL